MYRNNKRIYRVDAFVGDRSQIIREFDKLHDQASATISNLRRKAESMIYSDFTDQEISKIKQAISQLEAANRAVDKAGTLVPMK